MIQTKFVILAVVGAAFLFSAADSAIAGGTRNASIAYCNGLVRAKGLKTREERGAEYNKCLSDPQNYK